MGVRISEFGVREGALRSFEQLRSWQLAIKLCKDVYKITKTYPQDEKFGLTNQIRRAASSIPANIAEGFGRFTKKDKAHFYSIAYGSLLEVKSHVYLSVELEYISAEMLDEFLEATTEVQKQLNGLLKSTRS